MSTRDEILEAMAGRDSGTPPVAVFTQSATISQMERCGCGWPDANYEARAMAELAFECHRSFGFGTVRVPFCVSVEAERFGVQVLRGKKDSQPMVVGSPYRTSDGIPDVPDDLISPDAFVSGGRCAVVREALSLVKDSGLAVVAGTVAPLSVTAHILGTENLLMGTILEPDSVDRWISAVEPCITEYARLLAEEADVVQVTEGSASPDLLPPDCFERFSTAHLRKVYGFRGAYKTLHICGDATEILGKMARTGADGISIESAVDPHLAHEKVGGRTVLIGSVGAVDPLLMGTPSEVVSAARECADAGFGIIAPGCGVPPQTPDANLEALAHYDKG